MNDDLISRSALKEEFKQYICSGCTFNIKDYPLTVCENCAPLKLLEIIDNAPTVSDRYGEGYAQGYIDGSTGADWKGGAE